MITSITQFEHVTLTGDVLIYEVWADGNIDFHKGDFDTPDYAECIYEIVAVVRHSDNGLDKICPKDPDFTEAFNKSNHHEKIVEEISELYEY